MKKYHEIKKIVFKDGTLIAKIDGTQYTFRLSNVSQKLANASQSELENYKISPSGYGIHWPLIDEDISINGLLDNQCHSSKIKEKVLA